MKRERDYTSSEINEILASIKSTKFNEKPKLLIFEISPPSDDTVVSKDEDIEALEEDVFILKFATTDNSNGSAYLTSFASGVKENGEREDLVSLLTKAASPRNEEGIPPQLYSQLQHQLYLRKYDSNFE